MQGQRAWVNKGLLLHQMLFPRIGIHPNIVLQLVDEIGVGYTPYLSQLVNDIFLANVSYYRVVSERAAWATSLKYFSLGEIEIGQTPADFINPLIERPNEFVLDFSYTLKLNESFSLGVTGAFINSDLKLGSAIDDASAASTVAFGVSGYYQSEERDFTNFEGKWRGGFNIVILVQNSLKPTGITDYLPTNLKLGGGFDLKIVTTPLVWD